MVDFKLMLWHSLMRRAANQYRNYRIQKGLQRMTLEQFPNDWRTAQMIALRKELARDKARALYQRAKALYEGERPWNDFTK